MVANNSNSLTNPSKTVKEIDFLITRISWIYDTIIIPDETSGMTLEEIKDTLVYIESWSASRIQNKIIEHKFKNLLEKVTV